MSKRMETRQQLKKALDRGDAQGEEQEEKVQDIQEQGMDKQEEGDMPEEEIEGQEETQQESEPEIDLRALLPVIEASHSSIKSEMAKNSKDIEKKIQENSKEIKKDIEKKIENNKDMKTMEKSIKEEIKNIERNFKKDLEQREAILKKVKESEEKTDRKIEMVQEEFKEQLDIEKIERVSMIQESLDQVHNRFAIIEGDLTKKKETIEKIKENCEKKIEVYKKDIKEDMQRIEERIGTGTTMVRYMSNIDLGVKFSGDIKILHPRILINSMRNRLKNINNIQEIRDFLRSNMTDSASVWFSSCECDINSFQDFENIFNNYYWNETAQSVFREQLYFGKFNYQKSRHGQLRIATIHNRKVFRSTTFRIGNCIKCRRHFQAGIIETITVQNIKTMNQLIIFLQRIQRGSSSENVNTYEFNVNNNQFNNNNSNNNYSNNNNNNRNYPNNNFSRFNNNNRYNNNYQNNNRSNFNNNRQYTNNYRPTNRDNRPQNFNRYNNNNNNYNRTNNYDRGTNSNYNNNNNYNANSHNTNYYNRNQNNTNTSQNDYRGEQGCRYDPGCRVHFMRTRSQEDVHERRRESGRASSED